MKRKTKTDVLTRFRNWSDGFGCAAQVRGLGLGFGFKGLGF